MPDSRQHDTASRSANDRQRQKGTPQQSSARDDGRGTSLRDSPMMARLLDALEAGTDIGHFGRLTFVMVARFFLSDDELVKLLAKQPDVDESQAKALVLEVREHDYNPPRRNQIVQWQQRQDFPICPNADDPRACNVYDELRFPESVYQHITAFYEQQVEAHEREHNHDGHDRGAHASA